MKMCCNALVSLFSLSVSVIEHKFFIELIDSLIVVESLSVRMRERVK